MTSPGRVALGAAGSILSDQVETCCGSPNPGSCFSISLILAPVIPSGSPVAASPGWMLAGTCRRDPKAPVPCPDRLYCDKGGREFTVIHAGLAAGRCRPTARRGNFSAFGKLLADVVHNFALTFVSGIDSRRLEAANRMRGAGPGSLGRRRHRTAQPPSRTVHRNALRGPGTRGNLPRLDIPARAVAGKTHDPRPKGTRRRGIAGTPCGLRARWSTRCNCPVRPWSKNLSARPCCSRAMF